MIAYYKQTPKKKNASSLYSKAVLLPLCPGKGGQGDPAGGGAAPEAGQHASAGGEPDGGRPAQEVHRVVLPHHRQEALMETPSAPSSRRGSSLFGANESRKPLENCVPLEPDASAASTYASKAQFLLQFQ